MTAHRHTLQAVQRVADAASDRFTIPPTDPEDMALLHFTSGDRAARPRSPDDARAVLAGLLHRITPEIDLDDVDPAAPLQEAADLDSLDFLNLVTALYDETGIEIPERDYPLIATLEGFVARLTTLT